MAVILLMEKKVEYEERRLESLIESCVGMYQKCNIHNLMGYADALENINRQNPYIHLAKGVLYSMYKEPNRSYAASLESFNSFLRYFPKNEHAVVWRLYAATNFASGTPHVSFLAKIANDSMKSFPNNMPVLYAAYDAYSRGVVSYKESLRVALKILYFDPHDDQMRKNVQVLRKMIDEENHKSVPKVLKFRGVRVDNKKR
jgi:tetratricopeptide (TPR) repeat protein